MWLVGKLTSLDWLFVWPMWLVGNLTNWNWSIWPIHYIGRYESHIFRLHCQNIHWRNLFGRHPKPSTVLPGGHRLWEPTKIHWRNLFGRHPKLSTVLPGGHWWCKQTIRNKVRTHKFFFAFLVGCFRHHVMFSIHLIRNTTYWYERKYSVYLWVWAHA